MADTRDSAVRLASATTTSSPFPHDNPRSATASGTTVIAGPPAALIRFHDPPEKNISDWLSGDHRAVIAPSVPSSRRGVPSSGRIQSDLTCFASSAPNATIVPSGEAAGGAMTNRYPSGAPNVNSTGGGTAGADRPGHFTTA